MTDDIFETPSATPNFQTELAAQLAELVPEAIADGKVDFEKLKELLAPDVAEGSERFGLFWPGKRQALRAAQEPTTATLRPDRENSKDWDTTQNVFIEGDNLEVLKILQKHYHAKVKLIYIDPPYNTGKDFVYPDNYKEGLATYLEWTKQVNEEGKKISTNPETGGRYHSNWLNMMYPRLKLAKNLLTDDGLIFISIDDNEVDNLRKLCNEIFGEGNFAGQLIWKKGGTGKNDSQFAVVEHEYVLAYARNALEAYFGVDSEETVTTSYNMNDELGSYSLVRLDSKTLGYVDSLDFEIIGPDGQSYFPEQPLNESRIARWRWSKESVKNQFDDLVFANGYVYTKNYQKNGARPRSLLIDKRFGVTRTGKAEAEAAMDQKGVFDFPKPVRLIQHFIRIVDNTDAVVLDFFAGSGTTAQAVMQQNALDGGRRKFILVQLPQPTDPKSNAHDHGYTTISEIARKRIGLSGKKISAPFESQIDISRPTPDTGFRAFKLADTNFSKWQVSSAVEVEEFKQTLESVRGSSVDEVFQEDLLIEILLKQGYSLTETIETVEIDGLMVHSVGDGLVLAYLNEHLKPTLAQLRAIVDATPERMIILEDAFQGDDELKTNLSQLAKSKTIELWTA